MNNDLIRELDDILSSIASISSNQHGRPQNGDLPAVEADRITLAVEVAKGKLRAPELNGMSHSEGLRVLAEFGMALSGDRDVDGAELDGRLANIAVALSTAHSCGTALTTAANLRERIDLCPAGAGHWTTYCTERCEAGVAA